MTTTTMVEAEARYLIIASGLYGLRMGADYYRPEGRREFQVSNRAF